MKISEIFASFQGEGPRAGMPTLWVRFFGCNLECRGFGQLYPKEPETYLEMSYDFSAIKSIEDVPVPLFGCDSAYSWSSKFKHLVPKYTAEEVATKLLKLGEERFNMQPKYWGNKSTEQDIQLCFTGGEPMLHQKSMLEITKALFDMGRPPNLITIETNGTKPVRKELKDLVDLVDVHFSVSPKLFSVSGERDVVDFHQINKYANVSNSGALKFVVNNDCWDELDKYRYEIRDFFHLHPKWSLWAMPVGATIEQQLYPEIAMIVNEAMFRGFNIATRNHIGVYGNVVGT